LIPIYYPQFPIRQVFGFRQITPHLITKYQTNDAEAINKLAIEYYRINDRDEVVLKVVCNNIDVRNDKVMDYALRKLETLPSGSTLWILGSGGSGKTTILHRLAIELTGRNRNVYLLNLETLSKDDLETVLSWLKYCSTDEQTVLCIDNPAADEEMLETLLRRIPDYCSEIHILLAERAHRYRALERTGSLIHLHGEEQHNRVNVQNDHDQREKVYRKLFDLLKISEVDRAPLMEIALNKRIVYVNATYSILLELKRNQIIDFDFDWDDYVTMTTDLPAFRESYKYIALFYLFGVRTPFTVLSKIFGADTSQQKTFQERFRGLVNEPIILDERRDDSFQKSIYVRTKHEIISEIFFREHPDLNKDELLMEWCENTDFGNALEVQTLINIFGAKKNYSVENRYINFSKLLDFLLQGYLHEKVILSSKLNSTLHLAKFWLLLFQDKAKKAIQVLESFLELSPDDLHSRTELAKVYIKEGRFDDAETVLLKILNIKANDINSRIELAKVYQKQGRLTEAEAVLLELLEIEKRSIRANTELARIYQRQNKLYEAESILLDVLDVKPKDLNSRTELAKIYQRQNKLTEAETVLLELLEIDKNNLQARTELAKVYQRQNKLDKAETVLLELLKLNTNNLQARTELAKIYQRQGRWDKAIQRLEEYIELDPNGLHPRTELAKIYQRQGKLAEAETLLLRILDIKPKDLNSRTELAKVYQRQNKLDKAEAVLLESIEIDSKQLHARIQLAKVYQRQGNFDEAIIRAEEVLTIDPLNNYAVSELLVIWEKQGEREKCLQRFQEFIAQPDYQFSWSSQMPVFRFFQCCRAFDMKEYAEQVFERFKSELDERNYNYYMTNFK
jgi:tetratricopeptide (TPR) repeat protein